MSYVSLQEAATEIHARTTIDVTATQLLRAGAAGELLVVEWFSSTMRNLNAHKDEEVLGLLVVAARYLGDIEADGEAFVAGAFSLDGSAAYAPNIKRTREQLRIRRPDLESFIARIENATREQALASGGATAIFKVKKGEAWVSAGELLNWIADTAEPPDERPPTIATLHTQTHIGTSESGGPHYRQDDVTAADWVTLDAAWQGLPPVKNATRDNWGRYCEALEQWKRDHPDDAPAWRLSPTFTDPKRLTQARRMKVFNGHFDWLKKQMTAGEIKGLDAARLPAVHPGPGVFIPLADARKYLEGAGYTLSTEDDEPAPAKQADTQPQALTPTAAPLPPAGAVSSVQAGALPPPLTTADIAECFAGLYWDTAEKWKKPLGSPPDWLRACRVQQGQRGVRESLWDPVKIARALVTKGLIGGIRARARFQTKERMKPWLEAWITYEADFIDTV